MERVWAGEVLAVGEVRLIPLLRAGFSVRGSAVWGTVEPMAVVVIRAGRVRVWGRGGDEVPLEPWLERVPELSARLSAAFGVPS